MQTKNSLLKTLLFALTGGLTRLGFAAETASPEPPASQTLYPTESRQSFKGPEDYFTGDVQVDSLFPEKDTAHFSGAYVTFAPGARTAWHKHPGGQHMIVTRGTALTGTRDGRVIAFEQGETVWCPSDVDHWHGATPHAAMTHLVITGSKDGKNVIWKEKVSDKEYQAAVEHNKKHQPSLKALDQKQQHLIPIAAFTANGDTASLKAAIEEGLDAGLSVNEIKELQIHLYAYAGFPRALNGLATSMTVLDERKARGIKDDMGKEPGAMPMDNNSLEQGKRVQTELSGRPVTGPLFDFAPGINTLLQSHLFGDLFSRDVLDYRSREIATVSALASMDGVESQLGAHIRIATNVGLSETQLMETASVLSTRVGKNAGDSVKQGIAQVLHAND